MDKSIGFYHLKKIILNIVKKIVLHVYLKVKLIFNTLSHQYLYDLALYGPDDKALKFMYVFINSFKKFSQSTLSTDFCLVIIYLEIVQKFNWNYNMFFETVLNFTIYAQIMFNFSIVLFYTLHYSNIEQFSDFLKEQIHQFK